MLFEIAKRCSFLQNAVIDVATSLHPSIMHNLGKIEMIKKAIFLCEVEKIEGSYFEFGIYEGSSMLAAIKAHRKIKSNIQRNFYGFDSFDSGFKYFDDRDKHPFFKEGDFISSYDRIKKRLSKYGEVILIKGYFEETIADKDPKEICRNDKAAIVFIDCDLMGPALIALSFVCPILQKGSIIIVDDYFAYKGDENLGTCGAMNQFLKENKFISIRELCSYGYGGKSFIVTACSVSSEGRKAEGAKEKGSEHSYATTTHIVTTRGSKAGCFTTIAKETNNSSSATRNDRLNL